MRKLFTSFIAALMAGSMFAGTETVDFSSQGYSNGEAIESYQGTNFEVTFNKGSNNNAPKYYNTGKAVRCYGGNYFTVESDSTITQIEFTFASGEGTNSVSSNLGEFNSNMWTGESKAVKFTIGGTSGHRRIAAITLTYGNVITDDTVPVVIPDTIEVLSIDTLTCDSARTAAIEGKTDSVYVIGYVTEFVEYSEKYLNTTFWIADEKDGGQVFEVFRAKCETAENAPSVGDKVIAFGKLTYYSKTSTPELAAGGVFSILKEEHGPATSIETVDTDKKPVKVIMNGQLLIKKDNKIYTIIGVNIQ